jgi:hypothetical protein
MPETSRENGVLFIEKTSINIQSALKYLTTFDPEKYEHVDEIKNPKGGQVYLFYTKNSLKISK